MEMWTEIRRKVLVEGASKRSIRRDYGISAEALEKILPTPSPPAIARASPRPKPQLGPFLGVIDEILERRQDRARPSSATRPGGSSSASATSTATPACSSQVQGGRRSGQALHRRRSSSRSPTRRARPSSTSARRP